jgi:two-component system nitrogen regulation sensor histidine kinase NtrY
LPEASPHTLIKNISPRSAAAYGTGFVIALAIIAVIALGTLSDLAWFNPGDRIVTVMLIANSILIVGLAIVVGVRLRRRIRGRRFGEPAPRLHLRFVAMFSVAAAAPAILSAIFLGAILNRGVDYWFGERVTTLVQTARETARNVYDREADITSEQMYFMVRRLDHEAAVDTFTNSRIQFNNVLGDLTVRAELSAAYIVDRQGTPLAQAEFRVDEVYIPPTASLYELADDGGAATTTPEFAARAGVDGADAMRVLYKLEAFEGLYIYVTRAMDMTMWRDIGDANESLSASEAQESSIRTLFYVLYGQMGALLLVGATWLAISAATRVVTPISRLVAAAELVRRGDLDARVAMMREDDEITALGRAFNRMTRQLRSQRRELIESHAESEQRRAFTEAVLAGVSAGVIGLDGANQVTLINRSAASLLGQDADEVYGAQLDDLVGELVEIVQQARRHLGVVADAQIDIHGADDQIRNLSARAFMDEEAGLVITFDDVTRLVTAQRNTAWRDVARRIAHEIKNPLTPIQLSAERIKRKYRKEITSDLEVFDRCTETIVRQVSDIGRMVDEFASFARMPEPKVSDTEAGELVQAAVFAQRVASPKIILNYDRPTESVIAACDDRLTSQALANILKNAAESVSSRVKRDGDDAPLGQIDVSVREESGFAIIEVRDNGLGWPLANRERLTEPYMTTREKGTGLGLAIVKRVMEDHKGRLELGVNDDGEGAVVRLVFPLSETGVQATEHSEEEA